MYDASKFCSPSPQQQGSCSLCLDQDAYFPYRFIEGNDAMGFPKVNQNFYLLGKEGMFLVALVYLSVCLFVCWQVTQNIRNVMTLYGGVGVVKRTSDCEFFFFLIICPYGSGDNLKIQGPGVTTVGVSRSAGQTSHFTILLSTWWRKIWGHWLKPSAKTLLNSPHE